MFIMFRKDFYVYLPVFLQREADKILEEYSDKEWFGEAWEKFRQHVMETPKMRMKTPNLFFAEYINSTTNSEPKEVVEVKEESEEKPNEELIEKTEELVQEDNPETTIIQRFKEREYYRKRKYDVESGKED